MLTRMSVSGGVLALGSAGSALGDAHGNASCLGFEASGIAPAGSSDEFPGGMTELIEFVHLNLKPRGPMRLLQPLIGKMLGKMVAELPDRMRRGIDAAERVRESAAVA